MAQPDLAATASKQIEEMKKAGGYPTGQALERLALHIAHAFKARKQEVAILRLSADGRALSFVYPHKLAQVGEIPLNAVHSLAAKTIRDKRGEVVNNFPGYKHPTVFESVNLSDEEKAAPIQKIVSAPMLVEGKVVGVIEVSRKGKRGQPIGLDFGPRDLAELLNLGAILGKFLMTLPPAPPAPAKDTEP